MAWGKSRPYATDMAGFAVSLPYLLSRPSALFPTQVSTQIIPFSNYYCPLQCKRGHLESEFLKHLVNDLYQLEVASNQVHWMPHDQFNFNVGSDFSLSAIRCLCGIQGLSRLTLRKKRSLRNKKGTIQTKV